MGRPRTTMNLVCEKCGRDFSNEPTGTTTYLRHMARKNPCGSTEPYKRAPRKYFENVQLNDFEDVTMMHVVGPETDGTKRGWIRDVLKQVFSLDENKCVIVSSKDELPDNILVKRNGKAEPMNLEQLCILTLLVLHARLWPFLELSGWGKYKEFEEWVEAVSGVHLKDHNWQGTIEPASYYFGAVRDFWTSHLSNMPRRRHTNWVFASAVFKK